MTEGKWYPIFIYSEKNKGTHNTIMHSKQIVITVALPIADVCKFNYIHSNYNDIHYWTNPKISLIRTGAGPKLFGLVRFHCISEVATASVHSEKTRLKKWIMIIIMNKSQELTIFHGRQKLTSAKN